MLVEPENDPAIQALDQALAEAVKARLSAGARPTPDSDAIALRPLLGSLDRVQRAALRAVMGRLEAAYGRKLVAHGGMAQILAADRWGPAARPTPDADHALQAALEGARALIDIGTQPWWGKLLAIPELRIIGALPDDSHGRPRSLMVSTEQTGPTGDDRTFWVTDSSDAESYILEDLSAAGLSGGLLSSCGGLKLFALNGYVQAEDERLKQLPGRLCGIIGAAPVY